VADGEGGGAGAAGLPAGLDRERLESGRRILGALDDGLDLVRHLLDHLLPDHGLDPARSSPTTNTSPAGSSSARSATARAGAWSAVTWC
jgi:hypothetical protein